jgi:hypothetical protein
MSTTSPRRNVTAVLVALMLVITCLWWLGHRADEAKIKAEQEARASAEAKVQAQEAASAAAEALRDQCAKGIASACHQLIGLEHLPLDEPEQQEVEVQESEVQEPEIQEAEVQNPERQNVERQDFDPDDPEVQESEVDDPDPNDPEMQDPEVDDPEVQDPEIDDPDPNDFMSFNVIDQCDPPDGELVTNVDISWDAATTSLVLTCESSPWPLKQ